VVLGTGAGVDPSSYYVTDYLVAMEPA